MKLAVCPPFVNVVMRASAGTGKTFQLANRILSLMNAGESPERTSTVTCTRKAARGVLDRILTRPAEAAAFGDTMMELRRHLIGRTLDPSRIATRLLFPQYGLVRRVEI